MLAGSLGPHFDWLADADALELGRLVEVLAELSSGMNTGLYLRQLPIAGIDSEWIGANRRRVTDLPGSVVLFGLDAFPPRRFLGVGDGRPPRRPSQDGLREREGLFRR